MIDGWLIAFLILCIFFGPVYLFLAFYGLLVSSAPGTRDMLPMPLYLSLLALFSVPFIVVGGVAVKRSMKT